MTHVDVPTSFTEPQGRVELNNDGIGYVESYDFSTANMSNDLRIAAISTVASVCYQSPKALGSMSLYNRLANESAGLPSSSFEFVPVLLKPSAFNTSENPFGPVPVNGASVKYGEFIDEGLLTNLRALMSDVGERADEFFNTEEECAIIAKHFKVYKSKIDLSTRAQFIRHRVSWQELSRRYVSGKKSPFEFYLDPALKDLEYTAEGTSMEDEIHCYYDQQTLIDLSVAAYDKAVASGVKPEKARRLLNQSMYTTVWSAWQPSPLEVFYKLRLDKHAQSEIRELAAGMKELG